MSRHTEVPHGTTTGYSHYKCRCDDCRAAVAEYNRRRSAAIRAGTWIPDPARGRPARQQCSAPGCERMARYVNPRPLCGGHMQQLARTGDLVPLRRKRFATDEGKECSRCEKFLPLDAFNKQSAGRIQSSCRDCAAIYTRARRYGMPVDEMAALMRQPCAGCGAVVTGRGIHIDHCHASGVVRGVLCRSCNLILTERVTPETLRSLAAYLESYSH